MKTRKMVARKKQERKTKKGLYLVELGTEQDNLAKEEKDWLYFCTICCWYGGKHQAPFESWRMFSRRRLPTCCGRLFKHRKMRINDLSPFAWWNPYGKKVSDWKSGDTHSRRWKVLWDIYPRENTELKCEGYSSLFDEALLQENNFFCNPLTWVI